MHSNTPEGDHLQGRLSVTLKPDKSFLEFCSKNFNTFDPDQHDPIAIRMYHGLETVVTLYALDKVRQEGTNFNPEKMPAKKFKSGNISLIEILPYIMEFNFTLSTGSYDIDDMEVINK